ncbi:glycosyltransferase family 4 protein [Streptomyces sp. ACA25]|uniref:glycosyltransferase family 4 protein n=1 Tax=Streptomyces sp. ACA25 TaxID=3022596 RepID=UPI002307FEBA|nr:glycosyltransferase family 4 protein [Streptomyces sp. ACA25]MDB1087432.1 glycosyltransferase family 4 protein [Streptomyces sp. ACA25]
MSKAHRGAPPPRHVVVICHQYPPWSLGGLAEYAERFLHRTRREHPDVRLTLHTMNCPGGLPSREQADGLTIRRPRMPRWLTSRIVSPRNHLAPAGRAAFALALLHFNLATLFALLRVRRRGLVVAVHDWQSAPAGIAAALLRLPVIYHVHNTEATMTPEPDMTDPFGLIKFNQRLLSRLATRVVVPTPEMKQLVGAHGWQTHRVSVIPHGCESLAPTDRTGPDGTTQAARAAARKELLAGSGLGPDARILVFAGRLSPVKGIHTLLRALPEIARRHPRVHLFVLGVGLAGTDQGAAVDRLVAELGLQRRTHLYHRYLPQEELHQHYLAADVGVFPSLYEPFGLVSVEAMSLGTPVVLGPGFSGLIAMDGTEQAALRTATDSPRELADAVCRLLDDPAGAELLAARGREHARQNFPWSAAVNATLSLYADVRAPGGSG